MLFSNLAPEGYPRERPKLDVFSKVGIVKKRQEFIGFLRFQGGQNDVFSDMFFFVL